MAQRLQILSLKQNAATAAGIGVLLHHLIHPLDRQELRTGSWMTRLAAPLAATAFATLGRLETRAIAGGRFEGVAGRSADPLAQAGQLCGQGGEPAPQLINLLLLSQDQISGTGRESQSVRFLNPSRCGVYRMQSLPEKQTGIGPPSRVQQRRCSPWALPTEAGVFYWTVLTPDIVNPGREEQGSVSV
jgi:hypothetical protein